MIYITDNNNNNNRIIILIIIVTVTKSYSVYIKYYSKQGEKIVVLTMTSKCGRLQEEVLVNLIVGVVKHVTIDDLRPVDYRGSSNRFL
jgi:hypothetical protein